jgi:hypothetical protein
MKKAYFFTCFILFLVLLCAGMLCSSIVLFTNGSVYLFVGGLALMWTSYSLFNILHDGANP